VGGRIETERRPGLVARGVEGVGGCVVQAVVARPIRSTDSGTRWYGAVTAEMPRRIFQTEEQREVGKVAARIPLPQLCRCGDAGW
jgi:hypothetical protein